MLLALWRGAATNANDMKEEAMAMDGSARNPGAHRAPAAIAAALSMMLAACGGGGDYSAPATPPPVAPTATAEGAYSGSITTGSAGTAFAAVVLETGQLWIVYGNLVAGSLVQTGFIQGQGVSNAGVFTSSSLKDYGSVPPQAASTRLDFVPGTSISGTLNENSVALNVSGTGSAPANYNYATPASLASIAGNWSLTAGGGTTLPLTITAGGAASGTTTPTGCSITGTFTPRASGKNVFDVALTYGPAPCPAPGGQAAGIALYSTLNTGAHQLITAVVDPSGATGNLSFGTR
jgi:hypothetical protein